VRSVLSYMSSSLGHKAVRLPRRGGGREGGSSGCVSNSRGRQLLAGVRGTCSAQVTALLRVARHVGARSCSAQNRQWGRLSRR
jgi:hypothetical protein